MKVRFRSSMYQLVITDHAAARMRQRQISEKDLVLLIEKGKVVDKGRSNRFWIYKKFSGRIDNYLCCSVSIENPYLVVVTTLVNWRPKK